MIYSHPDDGPPPTDGGTGSLRERLFEQQLKNIPLSLRGPFCRFVIAMAGGHYDDAFLIAMALELELGLQGRILNREPTDPGDGSGWR